MLLDLEVFTIPIPIEVMFGGIVKQLVESLENAPCSIILSFDQNLKMHYLQLL